MATESTMNSPAKDQEAKSQSCCLGLLLLNDHMQQRRASPVCVGVKQKSDSVVQLPDLPEHLRQNTGKLQFMCLGYSIYEQVDARHSKDASSSGRHTLPHCEGVEVIRVEVASEPTTQQGPAEPKPSSSQEPNKPYPFSRPPLPSSATSSKPAPETGPPPIDWSDFAHRYLQSAQRTLLRMQLTWNHMYKSAFKPIVDKVLGDKDDKPS